MFNGCVFCAVHYEEEKKTKVDLDQGCGGCGLKIAGRALLACKRQWHPECFVCQEPGCKEKLTAKFFERDDKPYCELHKDAPVKSAAELRSEARDKV